MSIDPNKLKAAVDLVGDDESNQEIINFDEDRYKAVRFLKEYAKNPGRKYSAVAEKLRISRRSAENYIERYVYLHTVLKDKNRISPTGVNEAVETILRYYNEDLIKSNVPKSELLNAGEVARLGDVVRRYASMYRILEEDQQSDSELNTNYNDNRRNNRMSFDSNYDDTNNEEEYGQEFDHDGTPESILKSILYNNRDSVNPKKINFILTMFRSNPQSFITNPDALKALVYQAAKPNSKGIVDSIVFLFHQTLANNGANYNQGMGNTLGNGMIVGAGVPNQYQGYTDYYQNAAELRKQRAREMEEERFNEQLNKMMKMTLMKSLQQGAGGGGGEMDWMKQMMFMGGGMRLQMVQNPETGQYEASFVPGTPNGGSGNNLENTVMTTVLTKVLDNVLTPKNNDLTAILLPKLVDNMMQQPSLVDQIQTLTTVQGFINPSSGPKSRDELEFEYKQRELDIKKELLLKDIDMKGSKETADRERLEQEQARANAMMDKIMEGVNTVAEKGLPMLMQVFQTGMQNQQGGGQQQAPDMVSTPGEAEMVDGLNPGNSMALENEALYGAIDQRMNQFTADVSRTSNETIQQLTREVNDLKRGVSPQQNTTIQEPVGGSLYTNAYNQAAGDVDVYGEPLDPNAPIIEQGAGYEEEQGQEEFSLEDMKNASVEELIEAKKAYDQQKGKFTEFGEALEQELLARGTVPDETDLINAEDIDPDYIGKTNEVLMKEMKRSEREKNKVKSLWDKKAEEEEEEEEEEDPLDAPRLDDLQQDTGEKVIAPPKVEEAPLKDEPTVIEEEEESTLDDTDIENVELDEETEKKLQNLLDKQHIDEDKDKEEKLITTTTLEKPKKKVSKKKKKDQALPSSSDQG